MMRSSLLWFFAVRWRLVILLTLAFGCAAVHARKRRKRKRKRRSTVGRLMIDSTTLGAQIYVDNEAIDVVPMEKPYKLKPGKYTLKVSLPGHADFLDTFTIKRRKTRTLEIDLLPVAGVFHITSDPLGATVIVDGRQIGETPYDGELPPGERLIELRVAGYTSYQQTVTVVEGETYPLSAALVLMPVVDPVTLEVPWYGHWWVWAGAAVVAGGVTVAVLSSEDEGPPPDPSVVLPFQPER